MLTIKSFLLNLIIILAVASLAIAQPMINYQTKENNNYFELKKKYEEYWSNPENKDKSGWKQYQRWENFWSTRIKEDGTFPTVQVILSETEKQTYVEQPSVTDKIWSKLGPNTNPESPQSGIGRVNVVRFKPRTQKEIWIGAASGGVWKTTNHGSSWSVFDFTQSLSMGISDIAFCEDFPNVVYVATGDADGVGASTYNTYSAGIIKTTDGGNTWNFTNISYELNQGNIVSRLFVHPKNPDLVIASTSDGLLKSTDGGVSWRVKSNVSGFYRDLEAKPDDPNVIVAVTYSGSGSSAIFRTTDLGETWTQVKALNGVTRSVISFSPANPSKVYVLSSQGSYFNSFHVSADAGETWTTPATINTHPNMLGYNQGNGSDKSRGQAWYDLALAASPLDENEVYTGGINIWRTKDAGKSWEMVAHWYGGYDKPYVHADIHDLYFDDMSGFLYCGSDGGVDYSDSPSDRWINMNNYLNITQYYKIAIAQTQQGVAYGGSQDNGSHKLEAGEWVRVNGGDGMDCVVDYTDHKRAIVSMYYGAFYKTINGSNFYEVLTQDETGEAGAWVAPIVINPVNPKSYYAGYTNVWKSTDGGSNWSKHSSLNIGQLKHLAVSAADTNYVYAASSGAIAISTNGGRTFTTIIGNASPLTGIAIDRNNPKRIWVTIGGFAPGTKVMQYDGSKWLNVTGNLPNVPANCIFYQNNSPDRLYIGTDIGVFMTDYNSGYWEKYGTELPNIIVSDLEIDYKNKLLYAGTYGRGLWQTGINTCNEVQPDIEIAGETTFCQGGSVVLTAKQTGENFIWSTGETTNSISVTSPGIYSYSMLNTNGCLARSKSVEVNVYNVPPFKISTSGTYPICEGDTFNLELTATFGFSSYKWSNGETTRRIKILLPGKYSVTAKTKDNCEVTADFEVVISKKPEIPVITRWNSTELISSEAARYKWYFNDTLLVNDTNRIISISQIGKYRVEVFNPEGCSSKSDYYDVISSIEEIASSFGIHPNPTKGIVFLDFSISDLYKEIEVLDIFGNKLVVRKESINNLIRIDLSGFASGVYFIKLINDSEVLLKKIIKD